MSGSGMVTDTSRDQRCDERTKHGFAASAHVVYELEEAEIERQLVLRDAAMHAQPEAQQRPKTFDRVGMDFAEAVAVFVFVAGVFAAPVADGLVLGATAAVMIGLIVACCTLASMRSTTWPPRWIRPRIGGLSFSSVPRPGAPASLRHRPSRPFWPLASAAPCARPRRKPRRSLPRSSILPPAFWRPTRRAAAPSSPARPRRPGLAQPLSAGSRGRGP